MGYKYEILYKNYEGEPVYKSYRTEVLIKAILKLISLIPKFDIVDFRYRK